MSTFKDLMVNGERYVLVPFAELDLFCRSYEYMLQYALSKKLKEVGGDENTLWRLAWDVRQRYSDQKIIAIGQRLERFLDEEEDRYLIVYFPDTNPSSSPSLIESDIADMVHCEPEYDKMVCVFRA